MALPVWAYPGPGLVAASILLGHVLDYLYPYHRGVLLSIHPVHTAFIAARRLAPPYSSRIRGIAAWLVVIGSHLGLYAVLLYYAWQLSPIAWLLLSAWIVKVSFSLRLLLDTVHRVGEELSRGDLSSARATVQGLVRRDTGSLDAGHVASAALESLAESLVDGYTSPLLYAALLGPLGALLQRLINTLDGALGFKTPEYIRAGWLSALADTVVNYVPARLTALLIALMAPAVHGSAAEALKTWRLYARATESRNAGHPMSAMAGALGVVLEKPGHYRLGEGDLPGPREVKRGLVAATMAALIWLVAVMAMLVVLAVAVR